MQKKALRFGRGFRVAFRNRHAQAAVMIIPPGDAEGGPGNRHRGADQWLYVVSGTGVARINGRSHTLKRHTLLLIERGDEHEIRNDGRKPLRTLNFYVPPAYTKSGETLPPGRR